jgi:predicted PhzF superfamily epimerase YddE/YHI9
MVPHNVHIHNSTISFGDILATQPQLQTIAAIDALKGKTFPVVSIVKGMSFSLVDLTEVPEAMAGLRAGESPPAKLDEEWNAGLAGCLYYQRQPVQEKEGEPAIHRIHQRVMVEGLEDAGTGSASCALGCYLALTMTDDAKDHNGHHPGKIGASEGDAEIIERTKSLNMDAPREHYVFGIEQGVEMGRDCQICVEVDIAEDGEGQRAVRAVMLSGRSNFVSRGELIDVC